MTSSPARVEAFGQGCPGSAGTPELTNVTYSLPWIGDEFYLRVDAVPAGSPGAFFVTGLLPTAAQSLAPFGLVGCSSFVRVDDTFFVGAASGLAERSLQVPNDPSLAGIVLRQQALVLDAVSPGGAVVSNAVAIEVGIR